VSDDYDTRQRRSVTLPPELVHPLWSEIKAMRDEACCAAMKEAAREERLNDLLKRMRAAGMADHLPTIEEVQAAWRGET
jgi:hypothetical protein